MTLQHQPSCTPGSAERELQQDLLHLWSTRRAPLQGVGDLAGTVVCPFDTWPSVTSAQGAAAAFAPAAGRERFALRESWGGCESGRFAVAILGSPWIREIEFPVPRRDAGMPFPGLDLLTDAQILNVPLRFLVPGLQGALERGDEGDGALDAEKLRELLSFACEASDKVHARVRELEAENKRLRALLASARAEDDARRSSEMWKIDDLTGDAYLPGLDQPESLAKATPNPARGSAEREVPVTVDLLGARSRVLEDEGGRAALGVAGGARGAKVAASATPGVEAGRLPGEADARSLPAELDESYFRRSYEELLSRYQEMASEYSRYRALVESQVPDAAGLPSRAESRPVRFSAPPIGPAAVPPVTPTPLDSRVAALGASMALGESAPPPAEGRSAEEGVTLETQLLRQKLELGNLRAEADSLREQLASYQVELRKLRSENAESQSRLVDLAIKTELCESLKQDFDALTARYNELYAVSAELDSDLQATQRRLSEATSRAEKYQTQALEAKEAVEAAGARLAARNAEFTKLESRAAAAEQVLKSLGAENSQLQDENRSLAAALSSAAEETEKIGAELKARTDAWQDRDGQSALRIEQLTAKLQDMAEECDSRARWEEDVVDLLRKAAGQGMLSICASLDDSPAALPPSSGSLSEKGGQSSSQARALVQLSSLIAGVQQLLEDRAKLSASSQLEAKAQAEKHNAEIQNLAQKLGEARSKEALAQGKEAGLVQAVQELKRRVRELQAKISSQERREALLERRVSELTEMRESAAEEFQQKLKEATKASDKRAVDLEQENLAQKKELASLKAKLEGELARREQETSRSRVAWASFLGRKGASQLLRAGDASSLAGSASGEGLGAADGRSSFLSRESQGSRDPRDSRRDHRERHDYHDHAPSFSAFESALVTRDRRANSRPRRGRSGSRGKQGGREDPPVGSRRVAPPPGGDDSDIERRMDREEQELDRLLRRYRRRRLEGDGVEAAVDSALL